MVNYSHLLTCIRILLCHTKNVGKSEQLWTACDSYSYVSTMISSLRLKIKCSYLSLDSGSVLLPANHRQVVTPGGRLQIHQLSRRQDEGVYTCAATNYDGHSISRSLFIHIIGRHQTFFTLNHCHHDYITMITVIYLEIVFYYAMLKIQEAM